MVGLDDLGEHGNAWLDLTILNIFFYLNDSMIQQPASAAPETSHSTEFAGADERDFSSANTLFSYGCHIPKTLAVTFLCIKSLTDDNMRSGSSSELNSFA